MPQIATDAIVLHLFDYSETSRIVRLATREVGVVSALARGAHRSRSRFGTAFDLFAQGVAQIALKDSRDLQTLTAFDVVTARPALGDELTRFAGASALAELVLRFGAGETSPRLFDVLADSLDSLVLAGRIDAREAALAGAWRLVAEMGFAPSVRECGACHGALPADLPLPFSHEVGGVLCAPCGRAHPASRTIPSAARLAIAAWIESRLAVRLGIAEMRAHQRLLREFLQHHVADGRVLRAFDAWENGAWAWGASAGGAARLTGVTGGVTGVTES